MKKIDKSDELRSSKVERATIIGGGVIGASWAALFLANGLSVTVNDPDPAISGKVEAVIRGALPALRDLGYQTDGLTDRLSFSSDLAAAVASADLIQECGPERADFKQDLWRRIELAAPAHALLLSSSSSIPASVQNTHMVDPGRLIIGHPFNPPHLMPLVEVVPTEKSDASTVARVMSFYRGVGKVALELKKEIPGFVANRLQAAIFRECMYLVREHVVSMRDLDDIVTSSLGVRWATNGPFLSFHLGGGAGGMAHFVEHLGKGGMEKLWATFGDVSFDDATCRLLVEQASEFYGGRSIDALAEDRDAKEVAIINALASVADTKQV
ncbi:3-hydroxyacyl-CoA dehydrogenase NAD-binding domain-containing protein [Paraburkholderia bryophila]|uniref:3-hydroxyacyl-CoA dehydrogenase NAD-binding domain-containing protein n=1 Tax=Paraburkholderia bryophila TaxID=420952 RepID=UPI00234BB8AC|nr:3-hydroxyacyl-CoA dehydrogenase NAD-binding domain-containing protein [Paraburkholderia bryophila]WCM19757.1 3-hydroxyacyl-CoA dehydrogenase NAD-binding domain-containing protein [Paraburkholderia bryophila]